MSEVEFEDQCESIKIEIEMQNKELSQLKSEFKKSMAEVCNEVRKISGYIDTVPDLRSALEELAAKFDIGHYFDFGEAKVIKDGVIPV